MGEAPESPARAALRTGAQLVLAGREAGGYRLLLEAGFGCIERGVASSLAAGQRGGACYERVPCDEAVERFLETKLRSRQFIEVVATCASPEGLLQSAARNFTTDLLRRRAAERISPIGESRDQGPSAAWRGEARALWESHDEDADATDDVPASMAAEQLAARERFERLRVVDRIMVKLYFALGPLAAEEVGFLAERRAVGADEVEREVAARVERFTQARSAHDQALIGRRERLLLLRDRVALLVSLMQRLGEPVPCEQSASSGERWPCPVTEHQLLRLSAERRRRLAAGKLAKLRELERLVREAAELAQRCEPPQPDWPEIAAILGLLPSEEPLARVVNTLTQRVRRVLLGLRRSSHVARAT